ncbi:MAG: hypothetical protein FWG38_00015 [Defluviitaleaceae bacterium]|nr:hypothetical protein [Defluviitaleaceae bacterium]
MRKVVVLALVLMLLPLAAQGESSHRLVFTDDAGNVLLTDEHIAHASVRLMSGAGGRADEVVVNLTFTEEGTRIFAQATRDNIGRPIMIYVDGELVSSPIVNSVITDGEAVITGNFTTQTAADLVNAINGTDDVYEPSGGVWDRIVRALRRFFVR